MKSKIDKMFPHQVGEDKIVSFQKLEVKQFQSAWCEERFGRSVATVSEDGEEYIIDDERQWVFLFYSHCYGFKRIEDAVMFKLACG